MNFIRTIEGGTKWGQLSRRVVVLCIEARIPYAQKVGNTWMLPEDAGKPSDARIKSGKYLKRNIGNEMSEGETNGETI